MIAAVCERYGPPEVVQVREIATPAPGDRDVPIEVRATTVTSGDARMRAMNVPAGRRLRARAVVGLIAPRRRILGFELSGVVAAVGKDVRRYSPSLTLTLTPTSTRSTREGTS